MKISTSCLTGSTLFILVLLFVVYRYTTPIASTDTIKFETSWIISSTTDTDHDNDNNNINLDCRFYAQGKPTIDLNPNITFPYHRFVYQNNLIDLVFIQNLVSNLYNQEGWQRTKRLLEKCKQKGVKLFLSETTLFHNNIRYVASWFRAFGCQCVDVSTDAVGDKIGEGIWVSVGISLPDNVNYDNLIVLQTEQMTAMGWVDIITKVVTACKASTSCVIWDFSESNVRNSREIFHSEFPTVILPIMLSRDPIPKTYNPINQRDFDYIFFGSPNDRRNQLTEKLSTSMVRWVDTDISEKLKEGYNRAKICVSIHAYGADSGLEYHRLAQHVSRGCLPLYETTGDRVLNLLLQGNGVMHFAKYDEYVSTATRIIKCINEKPLQMVAQQQYVQKWWTKEIETFDKVLLAYFS